MCGISGLIGERSSKKAKKMIKKLHHRGPDGNNFWISTDSEFPVTLCHNRLAIIDLTDNGIQPFFSKDNRYVLTFNGEIYNFIELKKDLQKKGIHFKSNTDTEVLLEGLIHEGEDYLLKCNGMWSFCLWDRKTEEALLCRDRFGEKPLFYSCYGGKNLIFASEMKSITPFLNEIKPSAQIDNCLKYIFNYEITEVCVIEGIKRVKPGSLIRFKQGKLTEKKYWNSLDYINPINENYSNQVDIWKEKFLKSVEIRMRTDVPIGSALSGGLDSSSIVAAMNHISRGSTSNVNNDWQHLFHSSFPNSSHDETIFAETLAKDLSLELKKIIISPDDFKISVQKSIAIIEEPYLTLPLPMLKTYKNMKDNGLKVSMDGQGADELFIGYGHIKKAFICAKTHNYLKELIAIDESTRTGIFSLKEKKVKRIWAKQKLYEFLHKRYSYLRKIIYPFLKNNDEINILNNTDIEAMQSHPVFQEMDIFTQSLYEIFHCTILPTLLRLYDRCSMANGIEIRLPFMDWDLVCYSFSLPITSKVGGTFTKRIQRDAMKGILTDEILNRRSKFGWNSPSHEWFKNELKENLNNIIVANKSSKYFKRANSSWNTFQNIKNPVWSEGQEAWLNILPLAWESSLKDEIWK